MCKKSSEKEALQGSQIFDRPVKLLVYCCVVLVGFVILWVAADTVVNISYKNKFLQKLDKIQYVTAAQPGDSSVAVTAKDIEELLKTAVVEESTIMDSNNYLAIILTLITLCVSLSVVIPYIVGRSISAKTIRDNVEEIYTKDRHNSERKYRKYVEQLLLAEGHLSRMIAYLLLNSSKDKYETALGEKYDEKAHPYWAMGWASKSLIRYIKCYSQNSNEYNASFVKSCVKYIEDASSAMKSQGVSKDSAKEAKDKIIRAFIDAVDVIGFNMYYSGVLKADELNKVENAAKALFGVIKSINISEDEVFKLGALKSKYEEYLIAENTVTPTREQYRSFLLKKIGEYES